MITVVKLATEKAGGRNALAKALGVRPQAFYSWKQVPAGRVLQIERLTGIPRQVLRPDLYPTEVAA